MFYIGNGIPGESGFEMNEFKGFDVSPNGKYWGSEPIDNNGNFISDRKSERKSSSKFHK